MNGQQERGDWMSTLGLHCGEEREKSSDMVYRGRAWRPDLHMKPLRTADLQVGRREMPRGGVCLRAMRSECDAEAWERMMVFTMYRDASWNSPPRCRSSVKADRSDLCCDGQGFRR